MYKFEPNECDETKAMVSPLYTGLVVK